MEPPSKRPRLSVAPDPNDDYDSNEPGTDPIDIQTARAQNDSRLKSIFESIFQKYEKDFTEVGDEVDLETGEVVVDNGHLLGMQGEDDTGEDGGGGGGGGWQYEDLSTPAALQPDDEYGDSGTELGDDDAGDGETQLQHTGISRIQKHLTDMDDTWKSKRGKDQDDDDDDRSSVDSLLDTALSINDTDFPGRMTAPTTTIPTSEKAIPAVEESKPVESIWRVPEISAKFSTPSTSSRPRPAPAFSNAGIRSASPPGSRSLWALPQARRPRKADTDVSKPRKGKKDVIANVAAKKTQTKTKTAPSPNKPRHVPSSVDWSFADTPDGSESDDPLQEDYQPSPTPKAALNIRGKRMGSGTPSHTQEQHNDKGKSAVAKKQLDVIDEAPTESNSQSLFNISARAQGSPSPSPNKPDKPKNDSTPTRRARAPMTPDEIKLIVTMRHIRKKEWKEVNDYLPERKRIQLIQWNQLHWNERRACPPQLSKPWSQEEWDKLVKFKDQEGLTWPGIRAELPGRLFAEIEFELLRLWVGEEVWNEEQHQDSEQDQPGEQQSFSQQPGDSSGQPNISAVQEDESFAPADQGDLSYGGVDADGKSDAAESKHANSVTTNLNGQGATQSESYHDEASPQTLPVASQ